MTTPRPDREGIDAKELLTELAWSARHCKLGRLHLSREEALAIVAEDERLRARFSQAQETLDYWLVPDDQLDDPAVPAAVRVYHTREGRDAATRCADAEARLSQAATIVQNAIDTYGREMPRAGLIEINRQFAAAGLLPTPQPACAHGVNAGFVCNECSTAAGGTVTVPTPQPAEDE